MAALQTAPQVQTIPLVDPAATEALAATFAARLAPGDIIALTGDLGAGKTVFARALIRSLGRACGIDIEHVPSPTFTLVQLYELSDFTLYHFDLYRLEEPEEVWEIGIEDAFAGGVSVIEWAERIEHLLPMQHIRIDLAFGSDETARIATVTGLETKLATGPETT
ncbi:MAG: tRNA (adenosine(37)-N6)-threonylcarbamoyltransferase complex ATPase subunit type 1 TsaE [Rhodospirillaceae bacterium]|jgi:tRNA threonylcarbamoyladenosine biosynthesis protein TsaE|nr:tRNA (adenosine(37)-N6)-threonylcarbamoyltransferase complex ATPase subunit type 1 TsaE [Rhodospirillaceae bacterium]MBT6285551.1 tRNA (adenosine(37)-N6)-threonylcarbamoyltransferase complex ATPase subunit type 1 TsaE [Rhodospirillaceae bacterium]